MSWPGFPVGWTGYCVPQWILFYGGVLSYEAGEFGQIKRQNERPVNENNRGLTRRYTSSFPLPFNMYLLFRFIHVFGIYA